MTARTWARLRVLLLIPIGAILALLVIYRDGVPWWVLGLMLVHTVAVLWLVWIRATNKVKADRDD